MSSRIFKLIATAVVVALAASTSPGAATEIRPPLHVDGTVLRDQTGRRVGLKGVAVQMVPFYAGATLTTQDSFLARVTDRNYAQRDAEFVAIRSLGYDSIRLHIPGPSVYNSELYASKSATVARIRSIVASATAAGLIIVLDANAIGDNLANWRDYEPMFADLVAAIGNDPWVVWEPFNEPADYAARAPTYLTAIKGIGAYLRSLGSLQPLILPSNGYEQNVTPALMDNILSDAATNNWRGAGVLFGVHPYLDQYVGSPGNYGDTFTGVAFDALQHGIGDDIARYPLIVTEMGRYNNGITTTNATRAAYQWVSGLGVKGLNGLIAWDWDWALNRTASDPNAWTWDGLHLNPWGQQSNAEVLRPMTFPEIGDGALPRRADAQSEPQTDASQPGRATAAGPAPTSAPDLVFRQQP